MVYLEKWGETMNMRCESDSLDDYPVEICFSSILTFSMIE